MAPFCARERYFSLSRNVQTNSEAYQVSYSVGTRVSLQGKSGRSANLTIYLHSLPSLRMRGAISPFLHMNSWREQGQLYLAISSSSSSSSSSSRIHKKDNTDWCDM